jgi:hypothetical protein
MIDNALLTPFDGDRDAAITRLRGLVERGADVLPVEFINHVSFLLALHLDQQCGDSGLAAVEDFRAGLREERRALDLAWTEFTGGAR